MTQALYFDVYGINFNVDSPTGEAPESFTIFTNKPFESAESARAAAKAAYHTDVDFEVLVLPSGRGPKLVILESPYAGDVETHVTYARRALHHSLLSGEAPIASHLLYTQPGVLDDDIPFERALGIDAGLAWRAVAEGSVVYADYGISKGMQYGIDAAKQAGRSVDIRHIGKNPK